MVRLVLDVGNTKTAVGLFTGADLAMSWRIRTSHWTPDELGMLLESMLGRRGAPRPEVAAVASVVPQTGHAVERAVDEYLGIPLLEVNAASAGLEVRYPVPEELGADRVANALAAALLGYLPAVVADFGTATTFDVIGADGSFLGGAISPGVGTAASELFRKAGRISPVDLDLPGSALGLSTCEAVRSGVLIGAAGGADRLVEELSAGLAAPFHLATGGWAEGISRLCRTQFTVLPHLTLMGVNEAARRMAGCLA